MTRRDRASRQGIDLKEEIILIKYIDKLIKKLKASEKGQGMVEYALIIAFVAAIAIVALNNGLGETIKNAFSGATAAVSSASQAAANYSNSNSGGTTTPAGGGETQNP